MIKTGTYCFDDGGPSDNFLARVRTGGGGFTQETGEIFAVEPGDVLIKLDDGSPWFALFREPAAPAANAPEIADSTDGAATTGEPAPQLQQLETLDANLDAPDAITKQD